MAKTRPIGGSQRRVHALRLRKARRRSDTPLPWHKPCGHTEWLSSCALLSEGRRCSRLAMRGATLTCLQGTTHASHRDAPSVTPKCYYFFFFFNAPATTEIYTLSLHDALPIRCG